MPCSEMDLIVAVITVLYFCLWSHAIATAYGSVTKRLHITRYHPPIGSWPCVRSRAFEA